MCAGGLPSSSCSPAAVGGSQPPHQLDDGEVFFSDAIGEREPRPALAGEGGASFRVPVVLPAQEHHPLTAGSAPEYDAIRKLQIIVHVNPL